MFVEAKVAGKPASAILLDNLGKPQTPGHILGMPRAGMRMHSLKEYYAVGGYGNKRLRRRGACNHSFTSQQLLYTFCRIVANFIVYVTIVRKVYAATII